MFQFVHLSEGETGA